MSLCNECGNPIDVGIRVCEACGATAVVGAVESQRQPWILDPTVGVSFKACPFCGTKQKPGDRFCEECGKLQSSVGKDSRTAEEERLRLKIEAGRLLSEQQRIRAEEEARALAEQERVQREAEGRQRAEEEARVLAEQEQERREAEARQRAEEEARVLAEQEQERREAEARQRAEEEARVLAEQERVRQEAEAQQRAEEAGVLAEQERVRAKAEARQRAEEEAGVRAQAERERREAEARQRAEEEARVLAEEETRQRAQEGDLQLAAREAVRMKPDEGFVVEPRPVLADEAGVRQDKSTDGSTPEPGAAFATLETKTGSSISPTDQGTESERTETTRGTQSARLDASAATEPDSMGKAAYDSSWNFATPVAPPRTRAPWMIAGVGVVSLGIALAAVILLSGGSTPVAPIDPKQPSLPVAPANMVYIPGGEFLMGNDGGDEYEKPAHKAKVNSFFMDTYEVTCEEYQKFIKATGHKTPPNWKDGAPPSGATRQPVTGVDWNDASAYAQWANKRLPSEEEWEYAARGTTGWRYPWGNDWKAGAANANASKGLADVGSYQTTSPFGLFDMVGNAWEWTSSSIHSYPGGAVKEDQLPEAQREKTKVLRGGCYLTSDLQATTTYRSGWPASEANYDQTGFRCARDIPR